MARQSTSRPLSRNTQLNWLLNFAVFLGAVAASLSGIYFLYFVSGGYQNGRNPTYGITLLFGRETWDLLHTWGGVLMIAAVVLHLFIHLGWVGMMSRKIGATLHGRGSGMSKGAKVNVLVDAVIAISFLLAAISSIAFLFAPTGGYQGGANPGWGNMILFSRTTWDLIHTWAGTTMIVAAVIHLAIHWRWVVKVTGRMIGSLKPRPQAVKTAGNS